MKNKTFDIVILNGRPAAGKSEVIDFLKKLPVEERIARFHVGDFLEIDDFVFLWEQFEDDDLLQEMGLPRLISETEFEYQGKKYKGNTFRDKWYWNFLIKKISFTYEKLLRDQPDFHESGKTVFIEFARGAEHGGFRTAYEYLSSDILKKSVTLYIDVNWEESLRKNRRRYNPDRPDSILEHALEDIKLEKLYRDSDWADFCSADPNYLHVKSEKVPYGIFRNMPEKTDDPDKIAPHLEDVLGKLWKNYRKG